jgi:hypothetical protein
MAIMTSTCTVQVKANGSATVPEGNWKVISATGIATAAGAGAGTVSCTITVGGSTCVPGFFDATAGSPPTNAFADKSAFYASGIDDDYANVSAGDVIASVCGTAWDTNQSEFQVTLKRT